ncbi:STAS domain-containing protein [Mycolicibacterium sp. 050158]|jgi:anti-anti-sigma factor|uniref:STAS domain-containing protein n=1 Tax=Mycolicibacterium sp. 050158 TaxID=3090602 RepID=UPI00299F1992|nr:STAS domain-containing protein [Mycolicibacterium sp. 050158]MDX1892872.1 STAS domain-containing protein [Mycolicibacterium sp. 050158]
MTTPLILSTDRRADGSLKLVANGEIDLSNVATFATALNTAIAGSSGAPVTVDLSAIDYLDSGGINVLFHHADAINLVVKPLLVPVLTISGLTQLVDVSTAEAPTDA